MKMRATLVTDSTNVQGDRARLYIPRIVSPGISAD